MSKSIFYILMVIFVFITGCSAKEQVRLTGTLEMGPLPEDVLYFDGIPQIITVSTESNGDIIVSYISTDGKLVAQMWGCRVITLNCSQLQKQGRYVWDFPDQNMR